MRSLTWGALGLIMASVSVHAAAPPASRPQGQYEFRGSYDIPKLRTAIQLEESDPRTAARLKELRRTGFSCYKNARTRYLCSKLEKPAKWPEKVDLAIRSGLAGTAIVFPGPYAEPHLAHDGAQTEWLYSEPVKVRGREISLFKLIESRELENPIIQFPVNEEQRIPYVDYAKEDTLILHMILSGTDGEFKLGYFVEAKLTLN